MSRAGPPPSWLEERARRTPEAEALRVGERRISFRALAARARRVAAGLGALGASPGLPVGLRLAGEDFVVALHACWMQGAPALPLHGRLPAAEAEAQAAHAGASRVLDEGGLAEAEARGAGERGGPAAEACGGSGSETPRDASGGGDVPALLLFTSGTTGAPKAAVLSFRNLLASALGSALHLGAGPRERALACLPFYHVGGLALLVRSVLFGSAVVVHGRFEADAVAASLEDDAITQLSLVPTALKRLLDVWGARPAPAALRTLLLGGAAAPPGLVARARAQGFPVLPTYGLTEAASQVATAAPGDAAPDLAARLWPLPGSELRIVDEDGQALPPGAEGEIAVRGASVFQGYWRDPEATARVLRDGWLHTGDVGRLDRAGRLAVLDRRDDLVVSGGENVAPAEVEAVLLDHPAVAEAAVFGVPDADLGQRVVAWVVYEDGAAARPDAETLRAFCRARLATPKLPREVRFVEALPRTALGKVRRRALPEPHERPEG